jgi:Holliday junction resolvasome RuvABC endonuclease subunit
MIHTHPKHFRILAIAPSTRGFGFAVLEGQQTLVDWGVKSAAGNKNARCLTKVNEMIAHYRPEAMVLYDCTSKGSRRSARIRALSRQIAALASRQNMRVRLFSNEQVRRSFFEDGKGTKHALAELLAKRFPAELACRLPPARRAWMSEDYRMNIFDAVALAMAFRTPKK